MIFMRVFIRFLCFHKRPKEMPNGFLIFIRRVFYKFSYTIVKWFVQFSREKIIQAYGKQLAEFEIVFRSKAAGAVFKIHNLIAANY